MNNRPRIKKLDLKCTFPPCRSLGRGLSMQKSKIIIPYLSSFSPSFEVLHFFTFNNKEAAMYARLTFIDIDPKDLKQVSEIYNTQIAPQIRECKGIKDVMLLESTDSPGQTISITLWKTKEDADEYENSGMYRRLVDMVKDKFVGKPVLKVYSTQESNVPVM